MANIKISELAALTPPDAADLVPVTDASASQTKRTTIGEIVGIVNGDVDVADDGTATISALPVSKLQDGAARQLLQTDAAGTSVEWTSDIALPGTLDVTGQSTLASAAVSDLTSGRVVLAGTSGELEDSAGLTFNGTQLDVDGNVVITGDLTVEGASTILETETVKVEDKNIELGVVGTPTDLTADGGGITLKGTTDKTINWVDATDSWTSSEHVDLASGKSYRINGTEVLSSTTLGSGVTGSSLTSVGTLGSLTVVGTSYQPVYCNTTSVGGGGAVFLHSGTQALYLGTAGSSWLSGSSTADGLIRAEANLIFATNGNNQRAQIDTLGRLLLGAPASPAYQLQLDTDSAGKPSTNTWTIVSDERIKEEIELADLDLCYEAVKNIPLKRFKWKDEVYTEDQAYDRRKLGWIAQDVEAVFPKAVRQHEFKYNQVFEKVIVPAVPAELDEDGNVITEEQPERIEKGELISEEVIEDCRDLNSDQLYAAMYGTIQKLISKVELLEAEMQALKAA